MTLGTHARIVETTIAAPFEEVWRALRDPALIRRWHGWDFEGLDDEIDVIYLSGAVVYERDGTIEVVGEGSRFAVEDRGDATVVRVTKPAPPGQAGWEDVYDEIGQGWTAFVHQLRFALERHPGEERRTLHFDGAAGPDGGPLRPATLGLASAESAAVGERWEDTTEWGERLSGEVRHRTAHQTGLSIDAWNDALLVLFAKPAEAEPPHGGGRAILSTYGLADTAFAELSARWASWWEHRYTATSVMPGGRRTGPAGPTVAAMGRSNLDLVRALFERVDRGDTDAVLELVSEDSVMEIPPSLSAEPDVYEGHEGALRYLRGFDGLLEDVHFEPLELHEEGERVLALLRLTGRGAASGIEVAQESAVLFSFQGGKVRRMEAFPDLDDARESLR